MSTSWVEHALKIDLKAEENTMKHLSMMCTSLCLVAGTVGIMAAQDAPVIGPPPVLVIQREYVKPGRSGAVHEKSESAFVAAMAAAKWPTHYLAAESLSGRSRVLFMVGYPSFAAWEKDNHAIAKDPVLSAKLDRLGMTDGDLLDSFSQAVFTYDPEMSLHAGDVVHARYFEIAKYMVKPGHRADFIALVKMYQEGFASNANANWATFESYYGEDNGGEYLAISKMTSLAEDDASMGDGKKFSDAMGPEKMKKLRELTAACIDSEQTNLFEFNPKMSYPGDDWIKADPFWKPKAAPMAKKPAAPATP
jgi:hypothetical protein